MFKLFYKYYFYIIFRNLICNLIFKYIMLFWSIQITIASIIFIFIVHYLINFFKSVLTVPKIKDLVNTPNKKYESMYNSISQNTNANQNSSADSDDYTLIDLLPTTNEEKEEQKPNMKKELKNFLKKQMHNTSLSANSYNNF